MTQEEKKQAQQQLEDGFWYRVQPNDTDGWELMRYDNDFNDSDETAVFRGIGYDEDGIRPEEVHAFDTDRIDAQPCTHANTESKMGRNEWLSAWRNSERLNEELTPDDRAEVFVSVMLGESDFTQKTFDEIADSYGLPFEIRLQPRTTEPQEEAK